MVKDPASLGMRGPFSRKRRRLRFCGECGMVKKTMAFGKREFFEKGAVE